MCRYFRVVFLLLQGRKVERRIGLVIMVSEGSFEIESAERECPAIARERPVARFPWL